MPEGWLWCRLSNLICLYSGQDLTPTQYNDKANGIPYVTGASNIENGKVIINRWTEFPTTHATKGDLLLSCKGTVGEMAWCEYDDVHIARQFMALRSLKGLYNKYLKIVVSAELVNITNKVNGLIPGISRETILNTVFPFPPYDEQKRIYDKCKKILTIITNTEIDKNDLAYLISKTKSKILDLAIRGKLVPQNPDDEPASVLLERIRAEKEELIKQGKIKRDKKESVIFKGEDNSYYRDLPINWAVSSLSEITTSLLLNDGDWILSDNMVPFGDIKLIQLGSVGFLKYADKGFKYLTPEMFTKLNCTEIHSGYMLINRIVSDKMCACVLPEIEGKKITTVDTCWIAPKDEWYNLKYILFAISSPIYQSLVMLNSSGTTRKRISKSNLISLPLALPPLAEQKRIVEAIEIAFTQLDEILNSIS